MMTFLCTLKLNDKVKAEPEYEYILGMGNMTFDRGLLTLDYDI